MHTDEYGETHPRDGASRPDESYRKPGPVPRPGTRITNVVLDGDVADWAKEQPGGLSATLRRLLRAEMERSSRATPGSADPA